MMLDLVIIGIVVRGVLSAVKAGSAPPRPGRPYQERSRAELRGLPERTDRIGDAEDAREDEDEEKASARVHE